MMGCVPMASSSPMENFFRVVTPSPPPKLQPIYSEDLSQKAKPVTLPPIPDLTLTKANEIALTKAEMERNIQQQQMLKSKRTYKYRTIKVSCFQCS